MRRTSLFLSVFLSVGIALSACDAPANETSGEDGPQAAEAGMSSSDSLPVLESNMPSAPINDDGSMAEDSPGGEAVTEEEIPHSDVPPPSREVFVDAQCEFEEWVGKKVDETAIKETGRKYRILKPGSMMTMDHNPSRINIEHDEDMVVTRVWCG